MAAKAEILEQRRFVQVGLTSRTAALESCAELSS